MWGPKQDKVRKPQVLHFYCWIFSTWVSEGIWKKKQMAGQMMDDKRKVQNSFNFKLLCI